jgi:hypothetical protein
MPVIIPPAILDVPAIVRAASHIPARSAVTRHAAPPAPRPLDNPIEYPERNQPSQPSTAKPVTPDLAVPQAETPLR